MSSITINGKPAPKLGFGFMRLPLTDETDRSKVDIEVTEQMVDLYMQQGVGYFDTAHRYNDEASEPAIREAVVKRYPRERFILANKVTLNYIKNPEDIEPFFENQLAICGVDYFDIYLIHNVGRASYAAFEKLCAFDFLKKIKADGRAKHIGFSFHGTADVLDEVLTAHPETEFVQMQINYLDWEDATIQAGACYEVARRHGKHIIVMEPVKGGTLVNLPDSAASILKNADPNASLASWAIRFAASAEGVVTVLSGMSTPEQVEDNVKSTVPLTPLSADEYITLNRAVAEIKANTAIACTNCRYCTTECPQNIAIPDYFGLYNNYKRLKNTAYMYNQRVYYGNLAATHGKASTCIECGICESNCPQNLSIRNLLKDVSSVME